MKGAKALGIAATMLAVALSGCTDSGSDELDMFVTASDDPLTAPFTFKATGSSADTYTWDFGDGLEAEGKEVEHIFGFTDGDVTVKLTACTGDECESVLRKVPLGGDKNIPPQGDLVATTEWAVVGETVVLDATGATDANGDPILYRWSCERVADIQPPADGGGHDHGAPGVPFGVNALATYDETLAGGDDHGASLCADFGFDVTQPWSRDAGKISGNFAESGVYRMDVFVRDPKSASWIGRLDLYVSDSRPAPTTTIDFSGSLLAGNQGTIEDTCVTLTEEPCPITFDREERTFSVDIPNALGTLTFTSGAFQGNVDGGARWAIKVGEGTVIPANADSPKLIGPGALINGKEYRFIVEIDSANVAVDWTAQLVIENDLNPRHLFEVAPA